MSEITELFDYFRQCPYLENLWSIGATEKQGISVIYPMGSSERTQKIDNVDTLGFYSCDIVPYPSIYKDFYIRCFKAYDSKDSSSPALNVNVMSYDEAQAVCDWINLQGDIGNVPQITGQQVVTIECVPSVPQVQYVNEEESTIAYFVVARVWFVNKALGRSVEYES